MTEPAEILAQLDVAYENLHFADVGHPYYYATDARLHALSDGRRGALLIEVVGYNPRGANLYDVVHAYSNCLTIGTDGFENEDFLERIDNYDDVESDDGEEYAGGVPLVVRGQAIPVDAEPGEFLADTFRRLVPTHRELLLADEAELRRRVPADLPVVLRLDEWRHPDSIDEPPSSTETFRQLALVLSTGNPAHYRPTTPSNTHWSNWPESGGL